MPAAYDTNSPFRGLNPEDIPSLIDLRTMQDAQAWADSAMRKRPWREEFFSVFVKICFH